MAIITLTTDLGTQDFYHAAIKGRILTLVPEAQIIDISCQIDQHNIAHAAYVLKNAYPFFPKNTIHIVGVDVLYQKYAVFLALRCKGHYFIGPDNGLFSYLFDEIPDEVVELDLLQDIKLAHFPILDVFVQAAAAIASGKKLDAIGTKLPDIQRKQFLTPYIQDHVIYASIIYIDHYGNAITNISRSFFEIHQKNRNFIISLGKRETITKLSWDYNDVTEGDKLCLFGISGYLEIAINRGRAEGLLGLRENTSIQLKFI